MCDKRKVAGSFIVLAVFLLVFGLAGLVQAGQEGAVLGNLMAHKSVLVESQGADIRITDTTYAYFGGDRVRTGDKSSAAIRLGNDGALYLGPASVGTVTRSADQYVVNLEKAEFNLPLKRVSHSELLRRMYPLGLNPLCGLPQAGVGASVAW